MVPFCLSRDSSVQTAWRGFWVNQHGPLIAVDTCRGIALAEWMVETAPCMFVVSWGAEEGRELGRQREASSKAFLLPRSPLLDSQGVSGLKAPVAPDFFHPHASDPREALCTCWLDGSGFPLPHARVFYHLCCSHPSIFGTTAQPPRLFSLSPHLAFVQLTLCGQPERSLKHHLKPLGLQSTSG